MSTLVSAFARSREVLPLHRHWPHQAKPGVQAGPCQEPALLLRPRLELARQTAYDQYEGHKEDARNTGSVGRVRFMRF